MAIFHDEQEITVGDRKVAEINRLVGGKIDVEPPRDADSRDIGGPASAGRQAERSDRERTGCLSATVMCEWAAASIALANKYHPPDLRPIDPPVFAIRPDKPDCIRKYCPNESAICSKSPLDYLIEHLSPSGPSEPFGWRNTEAV
jgi:hypothetical protein